MHRTLDAADFEGLSPLVGQLRRLQRAYKPFGPEWDALAVALAGLNEAAEEVTGEPAFYRDRGNHR